MLWSKQKTIVQTFISEKECAYSLLVIHVYKNLIIKAFFRDKNTCKHKSYMMTFFI